MIDLPLFSKIQRENLFSSIPSPKVSQPERQVLNRWYYDYTAFSENFAASAIESLRESSLSQSPVVLDPFLGSGSSLVAWTRFGLPFVGIELSPFLALLCRAKVAIEADPSLVLHILRSKSANDTTYSDYLGSWYSKKDILYAMGVISAISRLAQATGWELYQSLLENRNKESDSACVALMSLLVSSKKVAKISRGSNPVWVRLASKKEISRDGSLRTATLAKAKTILNNLRLDGNRFVSADIVLRCADARSVPLPSHSVDIIITSPPYLNRLDYVISHQPELLLLSLMLDIDLEQLRKQMIGTTKIVEKNRPDPCWGQTCLGILKKIRNHPSKASDTYYIWNYSKYFKDMHTCLKEFKRVARPGSQGVLVIQNSHYKNIEIPVSDILKEFGSDIGIQLKEIKTQDVRTHMGLLSPRQRYYAPQKVLKEVVLLMNF